MDSSTTDMAGETEDAPDLAIQFFLGRGRRAMDMGLYSKALEYMVYVSPCTRFGPARRLIN